MARERRLCIDRVIAANRKKRAARLATEENPKNAPKEPKRLPGVSAHPFKIAIQTGKRWKNGKALTVAFLDGSATQRRKVEHYAKVWSTQALTSLKGGPA